jgi:signal transduction histidine kinase
LNAEFENSRTSSPVRISALLLALCLVSLCGCQARPNNGAPYIEFTRVPLADEAGPERLDVIEGRVIGARPDLQVVLFTYADTWYVQPLVDEPFTQIQPDSRWKNSIHFGKEYAALLVEPGYQPPASINKLPGIGDGVVAVAMVKGEPVFWLRWWFVLLCVLAAMSAVLAFYSIRLRRDARQLNLVFEERLAERTRVAQELHDTLLQGVISASMQLHVAVDQVPADLPAKPSLNHVLQVMGQVLEEGRHALQRLRSSAPSDSLDVEKALSQVYQELASQELIDFRVAVEGHPRPVHPIIRDEVYRIGREALVYALRHAHAKRVQVKVEYKANRLRVTVRDDGNGIDPQASQSEHENRRGLAGLRDRAEAIGARLKVRRQSAGGTVVELSVPGHVAFPGRPAPGPLRWLAKLVSPNVRAKR